MKIYMRINNHDDCGKLQSDLDRFVKYFNLLGISLNISKYKIMTFSRKRSLIVHSYNLIGSILLHVDNYVIDLGFKFNNTLDSCSHIDMICCKALKALGFVMRLTKEFSLNNADPNTASGSLQLERVQRKFLKYASFILGIQCPPHTRLDSSLKGSLP
ncbi:Hypothetical protein CINCED_3A019123 [Cinara cedri]|uniref:Reverse transcriptase domain n=1 Tax=Cinara cedri TaxID=506608 RepID=A0A5E4NF68_9HEMI|nr:Hypothetical protein CINCED_3A019123 [Cinara cedri]